MPDDIDKAWEPGKDWREDDAHKDEVYTITGDELAAIQQQADDTPGMGDGYNFTTRELEEPRDKIKGIIAAIVARGAVPNKRV